MIHEFKGWNDHLRMMIFDNEVPGFIDQSPNHTLEVLNQLLCGYLNTINLTHIHKLKLYKYTNINDMTGHKLYEHDIVLMPYGEDYEMQYFIIEFRHGGYVFVNLKNGETIDMIEYAASHMMDDNELEITTLAGNANTHKDILDKFDYKVSNLPRHKYRAFWTNRMEYYFAHDLQRGFFSNAFVHNEVKVINDILKGKYSPTFEFVPYAGVEDTHSQPIYNQDVLREQTSGEFYIVNETFGGFELVSVKDDKRTSLSSLTDKFIKMDRVYLLDKFEIVGTAYNSEELYEECGLSI